MALAINHDPTCTSTIQPASPDPSLTTSAASAALPTTAKSTRRQAVFIDDAIANFSRLSGGQISDDRIRHAFGHSI